ncbi:hypothetical protein A2Y99_03350 [Candidatus Gottesmanbacteria bacterium RBG_13_37_7]|uniref:Uncharacterized protein n=1 Tax=Candidatus Gottesmanbacteria bacterium RBG_13_37_7 TaxID=1798369 RepID=A0A1F5YJJ0_9BACT|nr:MAG: hypothetical protein A2Y99_03350 [Candidatus Gottesmanbacteria bacterium RBG_13_37_7]
MNEAFQILYFIILIVTIIILTTIGVQIILILSEIRKIFQKINLMMTTIVNLSQTIEKSLTPLTDITHGLKSLFEIINKFKKKGKDKSHE